MIRVDLTEMVLASLACLFFAIVYNTPKKELVFCWLFGGVGYVVYYVLSKSFNFGTLATLFGSVAIAVLARFTSERREIPVMVYILPAVYPLAPGGNMYNACYSFIMNDLNTGIIETLKCVKIVGMCSIGIILVLSLPEVIFKPRKKGTE